jgi:hypothetical protein
MLEPAHLVDGDALRHRHFPSGGLRLALP